jgi:hypothetical protein
MTRFYRVSGIPSRPPVTGPRTSLYDPQATPMEKATCTTTTIHVHNSPDLRFLRLMSHQVNLMTTEMVSGTCNFEPSEHVPLCTPK